MAAPETLVPRRYQEEVFTQAQRGNVIAALGTGSGKTYISSLLMKWNATRETSQGKVVIFLVPKVALVEQQGEFLEKTTSLRVTKLHGTSPNIDLSDRSRWIQRFQTTDVFVFTAQLFLNILTHSIWSIDKVSLLILDECHHARKLHPYNSIMREYNRLRPEVRPKVFGMTASPIWNPKDASASLATLEANLDSKVVGVRENIDELVQHSPKPQEVIEQYPPPPEQYDFPSPTLWESIRVFHPATTLLMDIAWPDVERRYHVTLQNLGPYCASFYLYMEMMHVIKQVNDSQKSHVEAAPDLVVPRPHEAQKLPPDWDVFVDVVRDFEPYFSSLEDLSIEIPLKWCSPKCIIFVEQRQVAACLASTLPRIQVLKDYLKCGYLVGQTGNDDRASKMMQLVNSNGALEQFRQGSINVLIATSVAEEGLDFPACDLVIRFDPLQHLVGYIQSRGRAREKVSKYIVMVQANDMTYLSRYQAFSTAEPKLQDLYQIDTSEPIVEEEIAEEDEEVDPEDLENRERYVVPSTNAFVNYDNAIALLGHLCALLPHDSYTALPVPVFTGDFQSTLRLPASLPLPPNDLVYTGLLKSTKKEAKRAAAFMAVKRLHQLDVFDDYLFPVNRKSDGTVDIDGKELLDVSSIPPMMDIWVRDPWVIRERLWIHPIYADGSLLAGIVTGTLLPPVQTNIGGVNLETHRGRPLALDEGLCQRRIMSEYTIRCLWYRVTAVELAGPPSAFLVPVTSDCLPDFPAMERLLSNPFGINSWIGINETHYNRIMVRNRNQHGRTLLLRKIRDDITPMSVIPESPQGETYYEYLTKRWSRKKWDPALPTDGPMIEVSRLARTQTSAYPLGMENLSAQQQDGSDSSEVRIIPLKCCGWTDIPEAMIRAFGFLPPLMHRLSDIYRVHQAKLELGFPPIHDDLVVQALTIPSVAASYNNQRLETLGDAVLEICTTVHLFNKFPHRHEGQLSILRKNCVCNNFLLSRALEIGLDRFVISEQQSIRIWPHVISSDSPLRLAKRSYPRRSLQDCMEATIGAAFVTGGIPMALHVGVSLGMSFGGSLPWCLRYSREDAFVPQVFSRLQEDLGYTFRNGHLLREAITHPSFTSSDETSSSNYQRLEFLGDAVLNLAVVHYLYNKFPAATSAQLALPRTKAVCSAALAYVAVKRLAVHKIMLVNSVDLSIAIDQYVPHFEQASAESVVNTGWRFDPPKALSDVFEGIIGAVLIDSGYDYERTACVVEEVMKDVLSILSPSVPLDPISSLSEWLAASGCRQHFAFKPEARNNRTGEQVHLHNVLISGPIFSTSTSIAKNVAAERALNVLQDTDHEHSLKNICDCVEADTLLRSRSDEMGTSDPIESEDERDEEAVINLLLETHKVGE